MKLYLIAGEASGDLHGANLIKSMRQMHQDVMIRAWGGDLIEEQGATLVKHYRDLAFMGFVEVLLNLRTILNNIAYCKRDILSYKPDAVILIDYPGFNLRIAEFAHQHGIKVIYYISPQIWAWKQSRVYKIKKCVDQMLVILPFEKSFYAQFGMDVHFVGHPLIDALENFTSALKLDKQALRTQLGIALDKKLVVLMPGSRKQEISAGLPIMLEAYKLLKQDTELSFVIAGAPAQEAKIYNEIIEASGVKDAKVIYNQSYSLLYLADAALVTSGTATLETALFNVPQVVCYKGTKISVAIARRLIKVKFISLVNLIMDAAVLKELIQDDFNGKRLSEELRWLLSKDTKRQMEVQYEALRQKLGKGGASENAAKLVLKTLNEL